MTAYVTEHEAILRTAFFVGIFLVLALGELLAPAGAILILGAPPLAAILFEILLNGTAMFNHGNFFIPLGVDRVLRLLVVTPDMHRVHHSIFPLETNSNFGFNLTWWDRLCGTYRPQPRNGHEHMNIGLNPKAPICRKKSTKTSHGSDFLDAFPGSMERSWTSSSDSFGVIFLYRCDG